ncbi:MAG: hypothetical protein U0Q16_16120 [Bryobacteraceae bacterium]
MRYPATLTIDEMPESERPKRSFIAKPAVKAEADIARAAAQAGVARAAAQAGVARAAAQAGVARAAAQAGVARAAAQAGVAKAAPPDLEAAPQAVPQPKDPGISLEDWKAFKQLLFDALMPFPDARASVNAAFAKMRQTLESSA